MAVMLVREELTTDLLPRSLEYALLRPETEGTLPLVYLLHGGGGSRDFLEQMRPAIENAWSSGTFPPAVVVTPSVERSFYMNYRDGSKRYEDAVVGPLLSHVRARHGASSDRTQTAIVGISMGGMGGLRIAFKHPDIFGVVAALEPGIEPAFAFSDIQPVDRFWRDDALFEEIFGSPVDEDYWAANNPANIARDDPQRLIDAGLCIYLECGDDDGFGLHRGTEFLHRVLFDAHVPHEYRLVRGADHLGATLGPRFLDASAFVKRALDPPGPDESLKQFHDFLAAQKRRAGLTD